jgi:hypothetical protein
MEMHISAFNEHILIFSQSVQACYTERLAFTIGNINSDEITRSDWLAYDHMI